MSEKSAKDDNTFEIEIDGVKTKASPGQMIIELTDKLGVDVPRFCYHKKLPIAANCRMCLVEVEKVPKPLPACATPVMPNMVVKTESDFARKAQKAVMEFLLINHPLDCPICDQGGECELQDVSMGYGRVDSRFAEQKRVVADKDVGPLIQTEMTRCIHCTRCVRFLDVVAGTREMGGIGRGEKTEIGTYVAKAIESEMSGNVIDICPVGALTAKPSAYKARAWELEATPSVAMHDAAGSNVSVHTRGGQVIRVVPRENEEINEVWISDRDRYSYQGLYHSDRATQPMIKKNGEWQNASWEEALDAAVTAIGGTLKNKGAESLGTILSPSVTTEEAYLASKLMEGVGCNNIDHRISAVDTSDDADAPAMPGILGGLARIEKSDAIVVVGSDPRKEYPIIGHRLRKASLAGAKIYFINPVKVFANYDVTQQIVTAPGALVQTLSDLVATVSKQKKETLPSGLIVSEQSNAELVEVAKALVAAKDVAVISGHIAQSHPQASALRKLSAVLAKRLKGEYGEFTIGANSAGAWLAGAVPARSAAGTAAAVAGKSAAHMLKDQLSCYLLQNVEATKEAWDNHGAKSALENGFVVSLTAYVDEDIKSVSDVILPVASYAETSGTVVSCNGDWQSFTGVAKPVGESRPAWKVWRVLANALHLDGFDFLSSDEVLTELQSKNITHNSQPYQWRKQQPISSPEGLTRVSAPGMYCIDGVVRRASALQQTPDAKKEGVTINSKSAQELGVVDGDFVSISQSADAVKAQVIVSDLIPENTVWVPLGLQNSVQGPAYGPITIEKVS